MTIKKAEFGIEEWNRYACDITGLESFVSWEKLNEAGFYIPPITPNWEDSPAGLRVKNGY